MEEMRLQKYIALSGEASRRKAEEWIREGRITVNGHVVTEAGVKVSGQDQVTVDGKLIQPAAKKLYIMLNKPVGYVSTARDQFGRKTVLDLVESLEERVYPVGRLDYDTSGLLLLTNDGDFTYRLTHPSHEMNKVYQAEIIGIPKEKEMQRFREGLEIEGVQTRPAGFKMLESWKGRARVEITIHEGRNRQVRKMCEAIGHPVVKLERIAIGELRLGNLLEGSWRKLTPRELQLVFGETEKK